ncbi:tyrosine-type recombinase/integrase [Phormidium tenue FACHB-886]|nr:tyrosine-type recombinase/integrase [Phormidium tenue FACHB-886]
MTRRKSVPDPLIVPLRSVEALGDGSVSPVDAVQLPEDVREQLINAFLQGRSLAPKSQKAYRQDLRCFLDWTDSSWAEVKPRQVAQFKAYLLRSDVKTNQRVLSDATVRRILGTLKNFYGWMVRAHHISINPTTGVDLPKLKEPDAKNLKDAEVEQIYQAALSSSLPERNVALISVLLHGLRVEEVSALNLEDYDGDRLHIRTAQAEQQAVVPLEPVGQADLKAYLQWRESKGEVLQPKSSLFVSHSRRNNGDRLGYDGIRKVMEAIAQQTGIAFYAHQFRHTFASNLILQGMNPHHVRTLTRHKSAQSFRRYTKTVDQPPQMFE